MIKLPPKKLNKNTGDHSNYNHIGTYMPSKCIHNIVLYGYYNKFASKQFNRNTVEPSKLLLLAALRPWEDTHSPR